MEIEELELRNEELKNIILDLLSGLHALSPFYRNNPIWKKVEMSESIKEAEVKLRKAYGNIL